MKKGVINLTTENLISQVETVRADLNMNPLGIPRSVVKAVTDSTSQLSVYPDHTFKKLKEAVSSYSGADVDNIIIGSSSYEFVKILCEFTSPKKAVLVSPGSQNYEKLLSLNGCSITYYSALEDEDFNMDVADFISGLSEDTDIVFISNPNGTTSQILDTESLEFIAKICDANNITMVVDEEYMDFVQNIDENSAIPLTSKYENVIVLRNTTKFFSVPGIRLAYMITSNPVLKKTLEITGLPFAISKPAEAAGIAMFTDEEYIRQSRELIHTERNLVYSALATHKSIKLYRPSANFILVKLLNKNVSAGEVAEHCLIKGLYIRNCTDIRGLDNRYIRFCFMNPKQDDLLVNTILEIV